MFQVGLQLVDLLQVGVEGPVEGGSGSAAISTLPGLLAHSRPGVGRGQWRRRMSVTAALICRH